MRSERLRRLMEERGLGAALLRRSENFARYTGGGNSHVEYAAPVGVADVVVSMHGEQVLASSIEAPRMRAEEASCFQVVEYPWEQGPDAAMRELVRNALVGADVPIPDAADLTEDLAALRRVLDADTVERLRAVGADLSAALAEAGRAVQPSVTEHDAAAEIAASCRRRGLVPTVLLAATHDRIARYQHPLPTDAVIERRAMLVASAQRGGLYATLTRIVLFEDPESELARRQADCDEILARMREEATRPGRSLVDAFADCARFYAEAGYGDEWRLHDQGRITGYASR